MTQEQQQATPQLPQEQAPAAQPTPAVTDDILTYFKQTLDSHEQTISEIAKILNDVTKQQAEIIKGLDDRFKDIGNSMILLSQKIATIQQQPPSQTQQPTQQKGIVEQVLEFIDKSTKTPAQNQGLSDLEREFIDTAKKTQLIYARTGQKMALDMAKKLHVDLPPELTGQAATEHLTVEP